MAFLLHRSSNKKSFTSADESDFLDCFCLLHMRASSSLPLAVKALSSHVQFKKYLKKAILDNFFLNIQLDPLSLSQRTGWKASTMLCSVFTAGPFVFFTATHQRTQYLFVFPFTVSTQKLTASKHFILSAKSKHFVCKMLIWWPKVQS